MSLEIKLDRASKFYEPGVIIDISKIMLQEKVTGYITIIDSQSQIQHSGIVVNAEGYMDTVSIIRGNIGRPPMKDEDRIYFMKKKFTLSDGGKLNTSTPIPFEFILEANEKGESLIDAYVGYEVQITLNKGGKTLKGNEKFYCAVPGAGIDTTIGRRDMPKEFAISPDNLEASTLKSVPKFKFEGQIYSVNCAFQEPFDGYIITRDSEYVIKSIEVQLVRVETFEGKTFATEVQNIQVADGDVIRDMEIPLYMLFPKIYSCPTVIHAKFSVINLIHQRLTLD
ncbi:down syndrome critical region protein 3 isoform 2 [Stylonychia lemnae]|uniref:Down syndrome critical region protein 3 isoform 2 n=1 Tax=Stylonychia lemnae TaxID=5949 RepID=A0A078AHG0_STYLE|nr:down syndrome critical region protein 3 isoform 2 [Stylonychia lemnae]|eukprot:CDW80932.1 down syndrome critical region protein 3 isoform 2 [Stylonychia lemnae]